MGRRASQTMFATAEIDSRLSKSFVHVSPEYEIILTQPETIMGPDDRINKPDDINQDDFPDQGLVTDLPQDHPSLGRALDGLVQ